MKTLRILCLVFLTISMIQSCSDDSAPSGPPAGDPPAKIDLPFTDFILTTTFGPEVGSPNSEYFFNNYVFDDDPINSGHLFYYRDSISNYQGTTSTYTKRQYTRTDDSVTVVISTSLPRIGDIPPGQGTWTDSLRYILTIRCHRLSTTTSSAKIEFPDYHWVVGFSSPLIFEEGQVNDLNGSYQGIRINGIVSSVQGAPSGKHIDFHFSLIERLP